jgi:hypothetical protein
MVPKPPISRSVYSKSPAAGLTGLTQAQIARDNDLAVAAVFEVFDEYGGWENPHPAGALPIQLQAIGHYPMKVRTPGRELSDDAEFQLLEEEVLARSDYEKICEMGFDTFYFEDYLWRVSDLAPSQLPDTLSSLALAFQKFQAKCAERSLTPAFVAAAIHPFFSLSLMRSLTSFTEDLYYDPEPVERTLRKMTTDLIAKQIDMVKASGIDLWLLVEERASAFLYPPAIFERFWWPYTRRIIDAFWSEGIVYCKRLIGEVGADGGFILGSGCSVPPDVRPENFRRMIETGKTYELSRS